MTEAPREPDIQAQPAQPHCCCGHQPRSTPPARLARAIGSTPVMTTQEQGCLSGCLILILGFLGLGVIGAIFYVIDLIFPAADLIT